VILVDSSVWIDYFKGLPTPQTDKLDSLLGLEPLAIGDLNLAEVLQGCDADFNRVKELLTSLVVVELGGKEIAIQAARYFRVLRAKGVTIRQTIDTIIATHCIVDNLTLLYRDKDFDPFVRYLGLQSAMPKSK
jgi:predicted nucleic acid-binding protein